MNATSSVLYEGDKTIRMPIVCVALVLSVVAPFDQGLADEPEKPAAADYVREAYRQDAEKCAFATSDGQPLKLAKEPVLRWANDDDWSGDVFVWAHKGRPELIGCILSGPFDDLRDPSNQFNVLAKKAVPSSRRPLESP